MEPITHIVNLPPGGISPDQIQILWHTESRPIPTTARTHLDSRWTHYLAHAQRTGQSLFNAPVTHFLTAHFQNEILRLELAPADFKSFYITCIRDHAWFQTHAPEAITPALGNSVLLTHHNQALLGIRSAHVAAYAGYAHLIGGVLEPPATAQNSASAILHHLTQELHEELNITPADLTPAPRLLALTHEKFLHQPELLWQWETQTPLHEIIRRLPNNEHSEFIILHRAPSPAHLMDKITPLARTALDLWRNIA